MKKITYKDLKIGDYVRIISGQPIDEGCEYVGKVYRYLEVDNLFSFKCIYADDDGNPDSYLLIYDVDDIYILTKEEAMVYAI